MGIQLKQSAGGAPDIEAGPHPAVFLGITEAFFSEWVGKPRQFGGDDDGNRWRFDFQVVDENEAAALYETEDGDMRPLIVDALVNRSVGKKSNAFALLRGILTASELAALESGAELDADSLINRPVTIVVTKNSKSWPSVETVIPRKVKAR